VDDKVTAGKFSYRLKQIDNDGKYEYSKTIEVDINPVKKYELSQNYPNPFNPATTIRYSIPVSSQISLKVYDVLGNEAASLINENKEPGSYKVEFDASGLSSGIYFYKLEAGDFRQIKKSVLLK
jgi:hypothetical protein